MISRASDYKYITNVSLFDITGEIIPALDVAGRPVKALRGEDLAFLSEACRERTLHLRFYNFWSPYAVRSISGGADNSGITMWMSFQSVALLLNRACEPWSSVYSSGVNKFVRPDWEPPAVHSSNSDASSMYSLYLAYPALRLPVFTISRSGRALVPDDLRKAYHVVRMLTRDVVESPSNSEQSFKIVFDATYTHTRWDRHTGAVSGTYTTTWSNVGFGQSVSNGFGGSETTFLGLEGTISGRRDGRLKTVDPTALYVYTKWSTVPKRIWVGLYTAVQWWTDPSGARRKRYATVFLPCSRVQNDSTSYSQKWRADTARISLSAVRSMAEGFGAVFPSVGQTTDAFAGAEFFGTVPYVVRDHDFDAEINSLNWQWQPT